LVWDPDMVAVLFIALGGIIGALGRYGLTLAFGSIYTIAAINILGSLLMGMAFAYFQFMADLSDYWRHFITIGLLGSFTTFSTFSLHIFQLYERGEFSQMGIYALLSVIGALLALIGGYALIRQVAV